MDKQTEAFWNERSKTYGGEIRFRSFVRLLGSSGDGLRNLLGLLYLIGDRLIFEDFEKENGLLGLFMKKSKEKFEKTLIEIPIEKVRSIKKVSQRGAQRKLAGDPQPTKALSKFLAPLLMVVHEIILDDGTYFYFEIMTQTPLEDALK